MMTTMTNDLCEVIRKEGSKFVLRSKDGKKVLEHLKICTIDQPTWVPNGQNGSSAEQYAFVREGQNSIIRTIFDRINLINNKKS